MFGTLFFDEARVNTAFRVRQTEQSGVEQSTRASCNADARSHASQSVASPHRCAFSCRGEVALPSLRASLLWWLDADANVVQLLVVNDSESSAVARACQSRFLSVEVPVRDASRLVTCGVTRNYMGDNGVAVVWVLRDGDHNSRHALQSSPRGSCLTAGFAQITVQREVDNTGHSSLLLLPDEQIVSCAPLSRIPGESFTTGGSGSACVVAELPETATARTASLVVLTDGARLWRVEVFCDGATDVAECADEHRRNALRSLCDGNEEVRLLDTRTIAADLQRMSSPAADAASPPSPTDTGATASNRWLHRLLGSGENGGASVGGGTAGGLSDVGVPAAIRRRLYAALSAVQRSPFVVLTRWNGQVEIYDVAGTALKLAPQYPIGVLPHALLRPVSGEAATARATARSAAKKKQQRESPLRALPAGATVQWAVRHPRSQLVHVVTCVADSGDGRPCLWTALPPLPPTTALDGVVQGEEGEILAQYCTVSAAPPTLSSTPLACAVTEDGTRLVVVSDIGFEEDAHLLCSRSLGALTLCGSPSGEDGVATAVQIVEAEGDDSNDGFHGLLRSSRSHGYLCQGVRMQGVVARGDAVVMVERGAQPCRLYTLEDTAADALLLVTEGVVVGVDEDDVYGEAGDGFRGSHDGGALASGPCGSAALESQRRVHYVPFVQAAPLALSPPKPEEDGGDPFAVFWEGVSVIQSCAHGARCMADLLQDVLNATTPVSAIASLPRFLSEAHLSGYAASLQRNAPATKASVLAAVRLALSPSAAAAGFCSAGEGGAPAFYEYSRLYVTQSSMGRLLSRLTFLTTTYLGWQSTQSAAFAPLSSASSADTPAGAATSADGCTQQLVTALEVLVAAYHAVPLAGADLVRVALVEDDTAQPTSEAIMAALLPTLPPPSLPSSFAGCELQATSIVQVVNRLRRCGTPRTARACAAWVTQLAHRFPLLQHYQLLALLENAAAPTQSARVQACCERVCQALAREAPADVLNLLVLEGFFLLDVAGSGTGSAFRALPLEELATFLAADPAMGAKLYAVGVLRRATGLGALYTSLSTTVSRCYLYAMLMACDESAERLQRRAAATAGSTALPQPPYQHLRRAFAELQVDVLLTAAQARVSQVDMAGGFHDMQAALDLLTLHKFLPAYAEVLQLILGNAVEVACASQAKMGALLRVTTLRAAHLEESLVLKWYNFIARLPTKSASEATEALRYRAIMGLHRYLMQRHSYAQCARLMSSLATLIRCSPLRRNASSGISVGQLAALALHAACMIAPSAPMPADGATTTAVSQIKSPTAAMGDSPLSLGYSWQPSLLHASSMPMNPAGAAAADSSAGNVRWLTRADIPWLQRRLYQAQCERQLWRRGCTLDCTDLWVEGAPANAYRVGVEKLVSALMQTRLWPQAFRFACLSEVHDPCSVLEEWAVDLLLSTQRSHRCAMDAESAAAQQADLAAAWEELIGYCGELATLENQFAPFVRTVTTALTYAYDEVPAQLLAAHRMTDTYTAMSTLFHVATLLRKRADAAAQGLPLENAEAVDGDERDDHHNGATSSSASSESSTAEERDGEAATAAGAPQKSAAAALASTRRHVWRALSAATRIALEVLQNQDAGPAQGIQARGQADADETEVEQRHTRSPLPLPSQSWASTAARNAFSPFTAGVMDPMAVCATELLSAPAYRDALQTVPGAVESVNRFLNCINAPSFSAS